MVQRWTDLLDPAFLARLERLDLHLRRLRAGEHGGEVTTARRGQGTLFREHRPYIQGDDPRFLDWNAYLRLDNLQIKEFEAEESPRMVLAVDRSASMSLREGAKWEQAVRLAAALGCLGLLRHARVDCILFPASSARSSFRGRGAIPGLLEHLATAETGGEAQLQAALTAAASRHRSGGIALVVSDFFATDHHKPPLRFLRQRGFQTHALHVVDERDHEVRAGERLEMVDVETGRTVRERIDRKLAAAYREAVAAHEEGVQETCRSLQVLYRRVEVGAALEQVVVELLRRGALAR